MLTIGLMSPVATVQENMGFLNLSVMRTGSVQNPETVQYYTTNGTAGSSDYTGIPSSSPATLYFAPSQSLAMIQIPITSDNLTESDETFTVQLTGAGGPFSPYGSTTVTIQDVPPSGGGGNGGNGGNGGGQQGGATFDVLGVRTAAGLQTTLSSFEGDAIDWRVSVLSDSSASVTFSATGLPTGVKLNTSTGRITGTIAFNQANATAGNLVITATSGMQTDTLTLPWKIDRLQLSSIDNQSNLVGSVVDLVPDFFLPLESPHTFTATGLPTGLSINSSTGKITGTIASSAEQATPHNVTVRLTSGTFFQEKSFTWKVYSLQAQSPGTQWFEEGDEVDLELEATTSSTTAITWAATGLPSGLTINSTTGIISGTLTSTANAAEKYTVTATATQGTKTSSVTFDWHVSYLSVDAPTSLESTLGQVINQSIAGKILGTSTTAITYSATGLPPGLSINSTTGVISGTIGSTASLTTPYSTVVSATADGRTTQETISWKILAFRFDELPSRWNSASQTVNWTIPTGGSSTGLTWSATGLPPGLSLNSSTGVISGTITAGARRAESYSVAITATDSASHTRTQSFVWFVSNQTITIQTPTNPQTNEGATVNLAVTATAPSGRPTLITVSGLPDGVVFENGKITGTVGGLAAGTYTVTVFAQTLTGESGLSQFTWTINMVSQAPVVEPVETTNSLVGDVIEWSFYGSDPENNTLTWSATGLPPGLTLNSSTGVLSGTIASNANITTPYTVVVTASDGTNSTSKTFSWAVRDWWLQAPENLTNLLGDIVYEYVEVTTPTETTPTPITYSSTNLPTGLSINSTTGIITGTISSSPSAATTYTSTIIATRGSSSKSANFTWKVEKLSIQPVEPTKWRMGESVYLYPEFSLGTGITGVTWSAANLPAGLSIDPTTGKVTGKPLGTGSTSGTATLTANLGSGQTKTLEVEWDVQPIVWVQPDNMKSRPGATINKTVEADYDGTGTLTYSATGLPDGLTINSSTGQITGTISSTARETPYEVTVKATVGDEAAETTFTWTVNKIEASSEIHFTPTEKVNFTGQITASGMSGSTLTYSVPNLPTGLSLNSSTGAITGQFTTGSSRAEDYLATAFVSDGTNEVAVTLRFTVDKLELETPSNQVNSRLEVGDLELEGSAGPGVVITYEAQGLPAGLSINTQTGKISGSIADTATLTTPHSVTVKAKAGDSEVSKTFEWKIRPFAVYTPETQFSSEGSTVNYTIPVRKDDSNLSLTFSATGLPTGLSINSSTGVISGTIAAGSHTGENPEVTITVTGAGFTETTDLLFDYDYFEWSLPEPELVAGVAATVNLTGTTTDQTAIVWSATGLPLGLTLNANTGVISGTPDLSNATDNYFDVSITATAGTRTNTKTDTWVVGLVEINEPELPWLEVGESVNLQLTASASNGSVITYRATNLPPGLSISTSGLITGTVTAMALDETSFYADVGEWSSSTSDWWPISNGSLTITGFTNKTQPKGFWIQEELAVTTPNAQPQEVMWYAEDLPTGISISDDGVLYGVLQANGTFHPKIWARDELGRSGSLETLTWVVEGVIAPPVFNSGAPTTKTSLTGQQITPFTVSATTVGDVTLHYWAENLPYGLQINEDSGQITGTISSTAYRENDGIYQTKIWASNGTTTSFHAITWTIPKPTNEGGTDPLANSPNSVLEVQTIIMEGDSFDLVIRFEDSAYATRYLKINWGDGSDIQTLSVTVPPNGFAETTVTHRYGQDTIRRGGDYNLSTEIYQTSAPNSQLLQTLTRSVKVKDIEPPAKNTEISKKETKQNMGTTPYYNRLLVVEGVERIDDVIADYADYNSQTQQGSYSVEMVTQLHDAQSWYAPLSFIEKEDDDGKKFVQMNYTIFIYYNSATKPWEHSYKINKSYTNSNGQTVTSSTTHSVKQTDDLLQDFYEASQHVTKTAPAEDTLSRTWTFIKETAKEVVDIVVNISRQVADAFMSAVNSAVESIRDIGRALSTLENFLFDVVPDAARNFINAFTEAPLTFVDNFVSISANALKEYFKNLGTNIIEGGTAWLFGSIGFEPDDLKGSLQDIAMKLVGLHPQDLLSEVMLGLDGKDDDPALSGEIADMLQKYLDNPTFSFAQLEELFGGDIPELSELRTTKWTELITDSLLSKEALGGLATTLVTEVGLKFVPGMGALKSIINLVNGITANVSYFTEAAKKIFAQVDNIKSTNETNKAAATDEFLKALKLATPGMLGLVSSVFVPVSRVKDIARTVVGSLQNKTEKLKDKFRTAVQKLRTKVLQKFQKSSPQDKRVVRDLSYNSKLDNSKHVLELHVLPGAKPNGQAGATPKESIAILVDKQNLTLTLKNIEADISRVSTSGTTAEKAKLNERKAALDHAKGMEQKVLDQSKVVLDLDFKRQGMVKKIQDLKAELKTLTKANSSGNSKAIEKKRSEIKKAELELKTFSSKEFSPARKKLLTLLHGTNPTGEESASSQQGLIDFLASCQLTGACFAAGTKLWTESGWKSIEEIIAGEKVYSRSEWEPASIVELREVEEVFVRTGIVFHLHLQGGKTIRTTGEHPFYRYNSQWKGWEDGQPGEWVLASSLTTDDFVMTHDGSWFKVEELFDTGEWELVYNMRVSEHHTYFVGEGEWTVWAHNLCLEDPLLASVKEELKNSDLGKDGLNIYKLNMNSPDWEQPAEQFKKADKQGTPFLYLIVDRATADSHSRILKVGITQTQPSTSDRKGGLADRFGEYRKWVFENAARNPPQITIFAIELPKAKYEKAPQAKKGTIIDLEKTIQKTLYHAKVYQNLPREFTATLKRDRTNDPVKRFIAEWQNQSQTDGVLTEPTRAILAGTVFQTVIDKALSDGVSLGTRIHSINLNQQDAWTQIGNLAKDEYLYVLEDRTPIVARETILKVGSTNLNNMDDSRIKDYLEWANHGMAITIHMIHKSLLPTSFQGLSTSGWAISKFEHDTLRVPIYAKNLGQALPRDFERKSSWRQKSSDPYHSSNNTTKN